MNHVSIVKCDGYDQDKVGEAMNKALDLLGGIGRYIRPGMTVLLKCNLLMKKSPEEHATTHPAVVEALVNLVRKAGAVPIIGDSPSGLYTQRALKGVYRACGMEDLAQRCGVELNYGTDVTEVAYAEGKMVKRITVIKLIQDVDAVISVAKLKTHGMTYFTGAVKNLFGVIPGTTKAEYHLRMKRLEDFSAMLVDICGCVKPVLSVMDAVVGMEGNGPSAGNPRKIGAILASSNPYALDVAAASLVGIKPMDVSTIREARERGWGPASIRDIEILGDSFEELYVKDFKMPDHGRVNFFERFFNGSTPVTDFLNFYLGPKPVFVHQTCVGCRECEKSCPPKAISMVDDKPVVDLKKCIRCFCCQELCPKKSVNIKRSWVFRMFR